LIWINQFGLGDASGWLNHLVCKRVKGGQLVASIKCLMPMPPSQEGGNTGRCLRFGAGNGDSPMREGTYRGASEGRGRPHAPAGPPPENFM